MTLGPTTIKSAVALAGEYRAGGTDLQQRLRSGVSRGPLVDLTRLPGLSDIEWDEQGRARVGALVPIATVASDPRLVLTAAFTNQQPCHRPSRPTSGFWLLLRASG